MPWTAEVGSRRLRAEAVAVRSNGRDDAPSKATRAHQAPDPRRFLQRRYLARGTVRVARRHRGRKPFGTFSGLGGPSQVDQPPLSAVPEHGLKRKSNSLYAAQLPCGAEGGGWGQTLLGHWKSQDAPAGATVVANVHCQYAESRPP